MKLSEIRHALAGARVTPVKTLGQNFLHDQNLARWIVDQAAITSDDFVVEIGPGLGALTEQILARGPRLIALEKDARLVEFLRNRFPNSRFEIRHEDALKFDVRSLFPERNVKMVGNLPYYVASQLLLRFLDHPHPIQLAVLMLQDELARRVAATKPGPEYGALTLHIQLYHRVDYLRKISNSVFFPKPDVASAIVRLTPRRESEVGVADPLRFRELVRAGFSQRRKQLRKLLQGQSLDWEHVAGELHVPLSVRAEELSREKWIALANMGGSPAGSVQANRSNERFPVVDEHDHKIGEAPRLEVHENNFRHRAVHILVFNARGEVLMQKRSPWKDRHPCLWDSSAAGHVNAGEDYDEAAFRELAEELGIQTSLQRLCKISASAKTGYEFIWLYRGEYDGPFTVADEEISAVKFFPTDLVTKWIAQKPHEFAPGFLECWASWMAMCPVADPTRRAEANSTSGT